MKTLALLLTILNLYGQAEKTCYFPPEFQGEYKMQNANSGGGVQYSTLNITANAIPIWGNCHRRMGNNFILMINYAGDSCIRCLHLKLRSKSVLQVHASSSQDTISTCYINEESAIANCPSEDSLHNHSLAEIVLFKTKDLEGNHVSREYCPIDGKYKVNYRLNDKSTRKECQAYDSSLDSCPSGSTLNVYFRQCTFDNLDVRFECLGQWDGPHGQTYLALLDNRGNQKPQYRCAIYKRNPGNGIINMAIGKDSTCTTGLHNATHGHESLVLIPQDEASWPPEIVYSQCSFPDWMSGQWEHVRVEDNTFVFKDYSSLKTYTIKCIAAIEDAEDKYLVFGRTQCGEEHYNCMRIQKRSTNIMEFQLGINFSESKDVFELCDDSNFLKDAWITQGRLTRKIEASCPISGEYTGFIPNTTELCAKLWSDCRAPELMYYQVSDCMSHEIYEEREYRCLGHWREAELLYTYTQRHDVAAESFECFVGSIISEKEDIYIKEAGEHCRRGINPLQYGMKLIKQGLYSCIGQIPSTRYDITTRKLPMPVPTRMTTKPWNIGSSYPTVPDGDNNSISKGIIRSPLCTLSFLASIIVILM